VPSDASDVGSEVRVESEDRRAHACHTSACIRIRPHASEYVSIRTGEHTPAAPSASVAVFLHQ
jgi:hypothetical protein